MRTFHITASNHEQAARQLADLEHYADRRDQHLDTLDLQALGANQLYQIFQEQDAIEEAIDWGHLRVEHLAQMAALQASLTIQLPLAA
ncbi:hypothetical protein [Novosphingobium sp. 9U]|uniref:hypothetical protein n=1 Tax=Novosphingobium sp. 9U TaxID=2653158 RepID=UPI0012F32CAA|nr:hypothetical protein [Novosphingobium sp. 9U]VWX51068.1 conserved hypothetical protein [Novosphingobium sp. 9U]